MMKKIDSSLFQDIFGLSCVENLVLYILRQSGKPFRYLYYDSFLTLFELERGFICKKDTFVDFKSIRKIQDIALDEGWIDMSFDDSFLWRESLVFDGEIRLIMVTPQFMLDKFQINAWRTDHYILTYVNEEHDYCFVNDHPPFCDIISSKEMSYYFAGKTIAIKVKEHINTDLSYYLNTFKSNLIRHDYYEIHCDDLLMLRDIIGVLRIIRRRIFSFVEIKELNEMFNQYLKQLDRFYASIEYMRIKDKIDTEKIKMIKKEVSQQDFLIVKKIIKQLNIIV